MEYIDQVFNCLIADGLEKYPGDRQEIEAIDALYKRVIRAFRQHKVAESAVRQKIIEPKKEVFRRKKTSTVVKATRAGREAGHRSFRVWTGDGVWSGVVRAGSPTAAVEQWAQARLPGKRFKVFRHSGQVFCCELDSEGVVVLRRPWRVEEVSVRNLFKWTLRNTAGDELILHAKIDLDLRWPNKQIPHHTWVAHYKPDNRYAQFRTLRGHVNLLHETPGSEDFDLWDYSIVAEPERITGERIA